MKNIRFFFFSENFHFLVVKFSVCLNRRDFVVFYFSSRSGTSQEILQNGQGNLTTKKIREKSGNFLIFAQNFGIGRYFVHFV